MQGQAFASFRRRYRDTRLDDFRLRQSEDEYLVHGGERLREAEALLAREDMRRRLQESGCAYLDRCRTAEDARRKKERRQQRWLRAAFAATVLLMIGVSFFAWQTRQALQETEQARQETEQRASSIDDRPGVEYSWTVADKSRVVDFDWKWSQSGENNYFYLPVDFFPSRFGAR